MRTLADMTEEERANCPGMWATSFIGYTGVIMYQNGRQAYLIIPEYNREQTFPLDEVAPRPDLPRAWNPDGTPVEMDVETGVVRSHPRGGVIGSYESPWYVDQPEGTVMRRFVGEWEKA